VRKAEREEEKEDYQRIESSKGIKMNSLPPGKEVGDHEHHGRDATVEVREQDQTDGDLHHRISAGQRNKCINRGRERERDDRERRTSISSKPKEWKKCGECMIWEKTHMKLPMQTSCSSSCFHRSAGPSGRERCAVLLLLASGFQCEEATRHNEGGK
jgi:hypothetical protein